MELILYVGRLAIYTAGVLALFICPEKADQLFIIYTASAILMKDSYK